jgi:hypothetical protein
MGGIAWCNYVVKRRVDSRWSARCFNECLPVSLSARILSLALGIQHSRRHVRKELRGESFHVLESSQVIIPSRVLVWRLLSLHLVSTIVYCSFVSCTATIIGSKAESWRLPSNKPGDDKLCELSIWIFWRLPCNKPGDDWLCLTIIRDPHPRLSVLMNGTTVRWFI